MQLFYYLTAFGSLAAISALPLDTSMSAPTSSQVEPPSALNVDTASEGPSTTRLVYWPTIAVAQTPLADADAAAPVISPSAALTNSERIQR